ncbi:hypothetical protein M153_11200011382 [Pseudoloma neurophilia]|uniref:Uncharacterized protein n=1 Tax=Pseudoloma neurophilia TaxID=146866 RepID=A0A0R0M080_9MICR|nr:hypothetical protein M153_11200011382 [Pseudoloma neurophilia]
MAYERILLSTNQISQKMPPLLVLISLFFFKKCLTADSDELQHDQIIKIIKQVNELYAQYTCRGKYMKFTVTIAEELPKWLNILESEYKSLSSFAKRNKLYQTIYKIKFMMRK